AAGHYSIRLNPGTYSATYSHHGYAAQTIDNIVITTQQTTTVDVALVPAAELSITKAADSANVNTGDQMGFTVTLTNVGSPQATGVVVTDNLPAGTDVDWQIDPANTDPGWAVTGSPPNQQLTGPSTVDGNASSHAHVISSTTTNSAGTYHNTASFT